MRRLALITTLFLLAGCGAPQPGDPTAIKNPDTLTYVTISDLDSLDPVWSYDSASRLVILNVWCPLSPPRYPAKATASFPRMA